MVRLLTLVSVGAHLLAAPASAADSPRRARIQAGLDLSIVNASGHPSWTEGSAGKLRYDGSNDGIVLSRGFIEYQLRAADTLDLNVVADLYADNVAPIIDFTEAFLEWRPLTATANRYRIKLGAFFPRLSLENTGPGWSSPYTISPSAINTWIGEELRVFGAEASVIRRPQALGGAHTFSLHGAMFYNNDTAGTLLAWKGWSIHDRISRFGDELPLPPLPQIQPGMFFQRQAPYTAPVRELDNAAGFYVGGEWRYSQRVLMRATHYDNRADPTAFEDGQYGWRTDFDHLGIQATLPGNVGVIVQWIKGATVFGRVFNGAHAVDAEYNSDFILLTKALHRHRISARHDRFEVSENDSVPLDENSERGHAWTLGYRFEYNNDVAFAAEWLQIKSHRQAWRYYGLTTVNTERQLQLSLRLRFGSR